MTTKLYTDELHTFKVSYKPIGDTSMSYRDVKAHTYSEAMKQINDEYRKEVVKSIEYIGVVSDGPTEVS
jgi:hypothetical protein